MRNAGCDLFPERDAFSYVKALPVKHPATEKHLRECIAMLCTTYTFSWSRWNASRNSREIVIQFKEHHGCVAKEVEPLIVCRRIYCYNYPSRSSSRIHNKNRRIKRRSYFYFFLANKFDSFGNSLANNDSILYRSKFRIFRCTSGWWKFKGKYI